MDRKLKLWMVLGLWLVALSMAGADAIEKLQRIETRAANALAAYYKKSHEISGKWPSSWDEMRNGLPPKVWHEMELWFQQFEDSKGFENSVFEKYVFITNAVESSLGDPSSGEPFEIVMVSSMPIGQFEGPKERAVVVRREEIVEAVFLPEPMIQKVFSDAGIAVPKPEPMPTAVDPEILRKEEAFMNKADDDWHRAHPEEQSMSRNFSSPGAQSSLDRPTPHSNQLSTPPTEPTGSSGSSWRVGAVLAGVGLIAFLLLRARRRV